MNSYFDNTPLAQDTYELLSPKKYVNKKSVYSPYSISTWNYGYFQPQSVESLNMWLHEMCHVIYFYHFEKCHRLLMKDYGYKVGVMTNAGVKSEAWVIALQYFLSRNLYGRYSDNLTYGGVLDIFNGRGVNVSVFEWEVLIKKYTKKHRKRGVEYYYYEWQNACEYVRDNR